MDSFLGIGWRVQNFRSVSQKLKHYFAYEDRRIWQNRHRVFHDLYPFLLFMYKSYKEKSKKNIKNFEEGFYDWLYSLKNWLMVGYFDLNRCSVRYCSVYAHYSLFRCSY